MLSKEMQPKYEEIYKSWGWHDLSRSMELGHLDTEYHIDMTARDNNRCLIGIQEKDHSHEFMERYLTFTVNLRQQHILRSEFFLSLATYHVCGYKGPEGDVEAVICCSMEKFRRFVLNRIPWDKFKSGKHLWIETKGREWFLRVPFTALIENGMVEHDFFSVYGEEVLEERMFYRDMAKKV